MTLEGRVALITGASRGIGRATAIALAQDGADVAVNFVSDAAAAEEVVACIAKMGRRAIACRADIGITDDVESMTDRLLDEFGFVDIIVNNAFSPPPYADAVHAPIEDFERQFRIGALGPARLAQLLVPSMREQGRGDIVMISSVGTKLFSHYLPSYHVGKSAMEGLAFTLAKELRRDGIRVNVVRPGLIATDSGIASFSMLVNATQDELDRRSPTGRFGRPEDIANVVRFLVSDRASFVSGQRIDVDAGGDLTTRVDAWLDQGVTDFPEAFRRLPESKSRS